MVTLVMTWSDRNQPKSPHFCQERQHLGSSNNKAIVDYTDALCSPISPFPPIGDAAYRQHVGGLSDGHRQRMHKKLGKDHHACGSWDIFAYRQTARHTDRHTHHNTLQPLPQAKCNKYVYTTDWLTASTGTWAAWPKTCSANTEDETTAAWLTESFTLHLT